MSGITKDKLKAWVMAALVRAVKTMAQTAVGVISASAVTIGEVDWLYVLGAAALAGVLSALTSAMGIPEVEQGESLPSIVSEG